MAAAVATKAHILVPSVSSCPERLAHRSRGLSPESPESREGRRGLVHDDPIPVSSDSESMDLDDSESDTGSAPSDGEDAGLDDSQSDTDLPSLSEIMAGKTKGQGKNRQDRLGKPEPRKDRRALLWGVSSDSEEMDLDDSKSNAGSAPSDDEDEEGLDDSQSTVDLPSIDKIASGKDKSQSPSSQERHTRPESQAFCPSCEPVTTCTITEVSEHASSAEDSETRQVPSPLDPDMPRDSPAALLPFLDTRPPEEQATENEKDAGATPAEVAAVPQCADTPYHGEGEGENEGTPSRRKSLKDCSHTPGPLKDASNSSEDELPPIPEEEDDEDDEDYDPVRDKAVRRSPKRYRMPPSPHSTSGEEDSESESETPLRPLKRRKVLPVSRLISVGSKHLSPRAETSPKAKPTARRPYSDDSSDTDRGARPQAKYEEWPLQNVILKRVTQDHRTVFQLQFEWDSLVGHGGRARDHKHVRKGKEHKGKARRRSGKGSKFAPEEDALLIKLKRDGRLNWREIHRRFTEEFPGRSQGTLQARYSSKLKEK